MEQELQLKFTQACWVGKTLFNRNKVSGSSANLSFRHGNMIYITGSGTCFGNLTPASFAAVTMENIVQSSVKPSKELPLHFMLYHKSDSIGAVIHTHSFYSVLWSCLPHKREEDIMPAYTPYLQMKVGRIGLIPYNPPGSAALFQAFQERLTNSDGYLLANHGPVIAGKDIMDAFCGIEELEESAHIAWEVTRAAEKIPTIPCIAK